MKIEEIARKYRNLHSGYRLIGYAEVGLPFTELSLTAYTIEYKPLSPVFEFTLKAIRSGIDNLENLSAFLGFETGFMTGVLSDLIRSEDVSLSGEGEDLRQRLKLTRKGRGILSKAELEHPVEQNIQVDFDRVQGRPIVLYNERRFFPRDIRDFGWLEIPAIPARRVVLDDLDIDETQRVIDAMGKALKAPKKVVLSIRELGKQANKFRYAIALRYQNEQGNDRISFALDGIINPDLETAFAANEGPEKLRLQPFDSVDDGAEIESELDRLKEKAISGDIVDKLYDEEQSAHEAVSEAENKVLASQSDADRNQANADLEKAVSFLEVTKEKLRTAARIRNLSVYEHPGILDDALKNSNDRLLIISPWIRRKVVSDQFLKHLERLLKKGVKVLIGFGIGDDRVDRSAVNKLLDLSKRFDNFHFREFGNTHAKVLISDQRFYVVGSFNWLSFKGDPSATFRDEQSIMVSIPEMVEDKFAGQSERFADDN